MKIKKFINFAFQNSLIPIINKPTRFTRTNATPIDHILTNSFLNKQFETGNTKTEISDHFPIFLITDPITSSKIKSKFLCDFSSHYEETFPKLEIKFKQKSVISPWITKGIMKSSKEKQKLYNKFLKSSTKENEVIYKAYKNLFEAISKKLRKIYYFELLANY